MKWLQITPSVRVAIYYGLGHIDKWKNRAKTTAKHDLPAKPRGSLSE